MAIGKASDFVVYQEQYQSGIVEVLTQNSKAFNDASRGAIVLNTISRRGDFSQAAFFSSVTNLISRRDTTSTSAATDLALAENEIISVKLNRKIGPVGQTRDAFRKIAMGKTSEELSFILGQQSAIAMQLDMLNSALRATRSALANQATNLYTVPTNGTLNTAGLVSGLSKFGDAADQVVAWIMHSKPYYDLVANQITANILNVSNFNVAQGQPVTMNRPVIVTDSDALVVSGGSGSTAFTNYYTLGLTVGGALVESTEQEELVVIDITGLENLVVRYQGEFAYNLGVKGFKYDITNGGANPADSAIATGSNWDTAMTSFKNWAGVTIQSR
jgi:hypothetical protein